jgi:hypothetical protein
VLLHWLAFGILSVLAVLLNANGLTQLMLPLNIIGMKSVVLIQEWNASSPASTPLFYVVLIATLAIVLTRGVKLRPGETLLLVFLLGWAFSQVRHQSWLAIVASILLTPHAAGVPRAPGLRMFANARDRRIWLGGALAVAAAVLLGRLWIPLEPKHSVTTPQTLLAHVPVALRREPVFNEYSFGGPLILTGVKPYIDGRADMYGDEFVLSWWDMVNGDMPKFEEAVRKYGIRWTVLTPQLPLVKKLDGSPEWRRYYSDEVGVIHVRR